jgi:cytochrome c oxidase cbb3-type subunit 4
MTFYSVASSAATVLLFIAFVGIVAWAYSRQRAAAFEEAANAPFALPDDLGADGVAGQRTENRS